MQEMAAAEAAAAKRKKIIKPTASVATVVDPSLPAGVGIMGQGRSNRTDQMSGCQTLSIGAVASWCTTRNHMIGFGSADRIRMLIGSRGFADVDNFVSCDTVRLQRHLARMQTLTLAEEEVLVAAHRNFQHVAGVVGERAEVAADGSDVAADLRASLEGSGVALENFRDVAHGYEDLYR